jgi:hypothetical protein
MGVCVNASTVFVPATPGPIRCARSFGRIVPKTFRPTNAGGYGPLLSQGRRKRIQLSNRPNRHCEERSDEAIHLSFCCAMDCFASLAMTLIEFRIRLRPRDARRPRCCIWFPRQRGRGECRAHDAPAVSCAFGSGKRHTSNNEHTTRLHRPQAAPSSCMPLTAHGEQSAPRFASHAQHYCVHRISSRARDDRDTPLVWDETAAVIEAIWVGAERKNFLLWDSTAPTTPNLARRAADFLRDVIRLRDGK